jgi:hypothetical protein
MDCCTVLSTFSVLFYTKSPNALNEYVSEIVHIVQKCWSMIIGDGIFTVAQQGTR